MVGGEEVSFLAAAEGSRDGVVSPVMPVGEASHQDWDVFVEAHPPALRAKCPLVRLYEERGRDLRVDGAGKGALHVYGAIISIIASHRMGCDGSLSRGERVRLAGLLARVAETAGQLADLQDLGVVVTHAQLKSETGFEELRKLVITLTCPDRVTLERWRGVCDTFMQ